MIQMRYDTHKFMCAPPANYNIFPQITIERLSDPFVIEMKIGEDVTSRFCIENMP